MELHHIKQKIKDQITTGDEVVVVYDKDDEDTGAQSGKYTIAQILGDGPYELMLAGSDDTETAGFITSIFID
jgi:hypothetical protein